MGPGSAFSVVEIVHGERLSLPMSVSIEGREREQGEGEEDGGG